MLCKIFVLLAILAILVHVWKQGISDNGAPVSYGMFHIIGLKMRYRHFIGIPDAVCVIRFNYDVGHA